MHKSEMNPIEIIEKYYSPESLAYDVLIRHSRAVARKALDLAHQVEHLNPDLKFIEEAAMLHDIGIFLTNAPGIGCFGDAPYICHSVLGRELLEKEGFPKHALVCERHTGTGLSVEDIERQNLPLPRRDMLPITLEEQIICFADNFFSKNPKRLEEERSLKKIRKVMAKFGEDKVEQIDRWAAFFQTPSRLTKQD